MTTDQFTRNDANRATLEALITNVVFRQAIEALEDELTSTLSEANPQVAAARYQHMCGANFIIKGLHRLTEVPKKPVPLSHKTLKPTTDNHV